MVPSSDIKRTSVDDLAEKLSQSWPAIIASRRKSAEVRQTVAEVLSDHRMVPVDASFVVFGSLARDELTVNSDVDWTLLVDGQADPGHLKVVHGIARRLASAHLDPPKPGGTFGKMAFSHSIIHKIGGSEDTNENTTQRVLLLLESKPIGDAECYKRVINGVLNRYLDDDISFLSPSGEKYRVPRFLLNDIVRYWRTMCVDYASKHRERQGQGWALRNAKLRMSRKLIFVSGLLTCFSCHLQGPPGLAGGLFDASPATLEPLLAHLSRYVERTSLEIVAEALDRYAKAETAVKLMRAYDDFLGMLNDGEVRSRLEGLSSADARTDEVFGRVREVSNEFQSALTSLFYDDHPGLAELTRKYGLF